ncbi:MAG: cobaltochelatase subunit CobN [Deltaproteobacteria bacterium]|jgi:cobaltochelatase CobN|nr:cobaltochelatase subunit CobN [Deltaproteobacteria bacterium]
MKITALLGAVYSAYLRAASAAAPTEGARLTIFSGPALYGDPSALQAALAESDLLFIQDSGEGLEKRVQELLATWPPSIPYLKLGHDAGEREGNLAPELLAQAHAYLVEGGPVNGPNLWRFLIELARRTPQLAPPPQVLPRFALWHPAAPEPYYAEVGDYLAWSRSRVPGERSRPAVGLLVSRFFWAIERPTIEAELIQALELAGLEPLPVFAAWAESASEELFGPWLQRQYGGSQGPRVEAIVKFISHFANEGQALEPAFVGDDSPARASARLFRDLAVPVFQPLCSWGQSNAEWAANPRGLALDAAWSLTLTEFEGVIEPFYLGGRVKGGSDGREGVREPQLERARRLAQRVAKWVQLRRKSPAERRVAFVLHNSPCASVEATVGTAMGLDAAESLCQVAQRLRSVGYQIEPPASGEKLLEDILAKKAISEFRWTSAAEIVGSGGALALIEPELYDQWYRDFPAPAQARLREVWGAPPGETIEDVPPAMVHEGKIIVSGLPLGPHGLVIVQPKRGCAGSRCDGRVCRILREPLIPPPHQYLAVYRWLADPTGFGADVVAHVGTHGSLEFLPGKGAGLSAECYPDLALGELPNLYVFAAEAIGDAITAKRRSYAALIGHLPPVYGGVELFGPWAEISDLLTRRVRAQDLSRRAQIEDLIREKATSLGFSSQDLAGDFEELALALRRALALMADSQVEEGLHILGRVPQGPDLVKLVSSILRYEGGEGLSLRSYLAQARGWDLARIQSDPGWLDPQSGQGGDALVAQLDQAVSQILSQALAGEDLAQGLRSALEASLGSPLTDEAYLAQLSQRIEDILARARACHEVESLLAGLGGQYILPGPSTVLKRGRPEVLPTGRNLYSTDPRRLPTKAGVLVGAELAEAVARRHWDETGRWPASVAFFWTSSDILQNDGEELAQILALMGLRPKWSASGLWVGVEVLPLASLGRPRIDVTIRVSGIVRDAFGALVDRLDRAIAQVAELDEPIESNFVRKHTLETLSRQSPEPDPRKAWRRATYRIFASAPGSCLSGVYLAVMASAWRDEGDLADIYYQHGAYAYGEGAYGELDPAALREALLRVEVNFMKLSSDAEDILSCGGGFGSQGGLALAAEKAQGRLIRNYCGDVRNPKAIQVRDLAEEIKRAAHTRILNPGWIAGQKKHGYKGAQEIARRVSDAYGWQATTKAVDPSIFEGVARTYFLDPENREFFEKRNPHALEEMGRRLLEAASRSLWRPDPELLEELKSAYLSLEGILEEGLELFGGEIQGGAVDIVTVADVASWKEKMAALKSGMTSTEATATQATPNRAT